MDRHPRPLAALARSGVPLDYGNAEGLQGAPRLLARLQGLLPEGVAGQRAAQEEGRHAGLRRQEGVLHWEVGRDHVGAVLHHGGRQERGVGLAEGGPPTRGEEGVDPSVERDTDWEGRELDRGRVEPQEEALEDADRHLVGVFG